MRGGVHPSRHRPRVHGAVPLSGGPDAGRRQPDTAGRRHGGRRLRRRLAGSARPPVFASSLGPTRRLTPSRLPGPFAHSGARTGLAPLQEPPETIRRPPDAVITASRWNAIDPTTRRAARPTAQRAFSAALRTGEPSCPRRDRGRNGYSLSPAGRHPRRPSTSGTVRGRPRSPALPSRRRRLGHPQPYTDDDANDEAVRSGERILSAYDLGSSAVDHH